MRWGRLPTWNPAKHKPWRGRAELSPHGCTGEEPITQSPLVCGMSYTCASKADLQRRHSGYGASLAAQHKYGHRRVQLLQLLDQLRDGTANGSTRRILTCPMAYAEVRLAIEARLWHCYQSGGKAAYGVAWLVEVVGEARAAWSLPAWCPQARCPSQ